MTLPPIFEIGPIGVAYSGVAGQEHVYFRPAEPINLAQYGILLGYQNESGLVTPLRDESFWFGDIVVNPPCWIVLYTGKGEYHETFHQHTNHPVHMFYWGKETTIFVARELVPILYRMGGVLIGGHLSPPPKLSELKPPPALPAGPANIVTK